MMLPRYRCDRTYKWNFDNAPEPVDILIPSMSSDSRDWNFLGLPIDSPIGIAAGPLLNGKWVRYYSSLGFSVLTYKTVRSSARECYPVPNLSPVACGQLTGTEVDIPESEPTTSSWAVSFGMPSKDPAHWRADIEATRRCLPNKSVLSVSVVGTMRHGWSIDELADDYALCAKWAVESGADSVEANFSCPNVTSFDGQLYQNAGDAATIAERVRSAIGATPFLIKIGYFRDVTENVEPAEELLRAVSAHADGIATTNSIATTVAGLNGRLLFDGQPRGICGDAIRGESIRQTASLHRIIHDNELPLRIVGVGGISKSDHVRDYLAAGAHSVQLATSVMLDPFVGVKIRETLSGR